MPGTDEPLDALIVGAGPAGLTAATYLTRFRRHIAVVDSGHSRARWIPESHNCPGFPNGVAGTSLLARLRLQAEEYGARIETGHITSLRRDADSFVATAVDGRSWRAHHVLLATGIVDRMPDMANVDDAVASGALRLCAVCDGYEASDERIAVLAPADEAIGHALFLRTFSTRVSVLPSDATPPSADCARQARDAGIPVLPVPRALHYVAGTGCRAEFAPGTAEQQVFDTVYPVLGGDVQSELATGLGARCDEDGALEIDDHLQTSVEGLYAIGDVVSALNQISVAVGQAAIAATAIHNRLPHNFRGRG